MNCVHLWLWNFESLQSLTIEVDGVDMGQQLFSINVGHTRAQAKVPWAELTVHVVQSMGHRIDGIHHKLHLPLLFIDGVTANFLQPWNKVDRLKLPNI